MRRISLLLPLALLLALPSASAGQEAFPPADRTRTWAGVGLGGANLPSAFQDCSAEMRGGMDARAAVRRGWIGVELRGQLLSEFATEDCAFAAPDPAALLPPRDGIVTNVGHPYDPSSTHLATDARLRVGGTGAVPVSVAAGGGWLFGAGEPYVTAGVGFGTGLGPVRLTLDLERSWYRVRSERVTTEWREGVFVREVSREERTDWSRHGGVRVGLEVAVR